MNSSIVNFREISRLAEKCETVAFVDKIRSCDVIVKTGEVTENRFNEIGRGSLKTIGKVSERTEKRFNVE